MSNKKKVIVIVLVFALIVAGAYFLYNVLVDGTNKEQLSTQQNSDSQKEESGKEKFKAPDFVVYDGDKKKIGLSDFSGKPVVLNFWASWCQPCKSEMADFDQVYKEKGQEIQFMMVNMTDGSRETQETAYRYIKEQGFSFPVFYDSDSSAANNYAAYSIPMTFFIDKEGYLIARASGAIDKETLLQGIEMISG